MIEVSIDSLVNFFLIVLIIDLHHLILVFIFPVVTVSIAIIIVLLIVYHFYFIVSKPHSFYLVFLSIIYEFVRLLLFSFKKFESQRFNYIRLFVKIHNSVRVNHLVLNLLMLEIGFFILADSIDLNLKSDHLFFFDQKFILFLIILILISHRISPHLNRYYVYRIFSATVL